MNVQIFSFISGHKPFFYFIFLPLVLNEQAMYGSLNTFNNSSQMNEMWAKLFQIL